MRRLPPLVACVLLLALAPSAPAAISPRIVGGEDVTQNYPAQAEVDVRMGLQQELCGGTLIDPQWVLTAGHCVTQDTLLGPQLVDASAFTVKLGSANLGGGTPFAVDGVAREPGYSNDSLADDAALLHLSTPAPQAPLPLIDDATLGAASPGVLARVLGWGFTAEGGQISQTLRQVDVTIQTDATCEQTLGADTSTMLCAGEPAGGKDACQGDSGGPLMVATGRGLILAGIVSFGNGCAEPGQFGVYTRLANASIRGWIASMVPSVQSAQAAAAAIADRPATFSKAGCTRTTCRVTVAFPASGTASASLRVSGAKRRSLGLSSRTIAHARKTLAGTRVLKLAIPRAARRSLTGRRVAAQLAVAAVTTGNVSSSRTFAVRLRGSR